MIKMLSYIFGSLQASENAVKNIKKTLISQAKFNRTVATFALVMAAYAITVEIHTYEQNKKIEELNDQIKELKRMKGE